MSDRKVLVAGIGNVFLGDDGFGVEVVRRLAERPMLAGVRVMDFGIRGMDLTYALLEPHDLVVLVDVVQRGGKPGTLYLLEVPEGGEGPASFEAHGMVPSRAIRTARAMGGKITNTFIVACEPETFGDPELGKMGLSSAVLAAVDEAIGMVESLVSPRSSEVRSHA